MDVTGKYTVEEPDNNSSNTPKATSIHLSHENLSISVEDDATTLGHDESTNILEAVPQLASPIQPEQKLGKSEVLDIPNANERETSTTALALTGPESSINEIEDKTRSLIYSFLHNIDFKDTIKCITEIASPSTIHLVITTAINHVLERSSQARSSFGQLLHNLVQSKIITMEQYYNGVKPILELIDVHALNIPLIWEYLAEIFEPMLSGDDITFLEIMLQPFCPSFTAAKLVAAILRCASKKRGQAKVAELWKRSELQWPFFLGSQNLDEFLKAHDVEFTVGPMEVAKAFEILSSYLKNFSKNNDQIVDWIKFHMGDKIFNPTFIRVLITSIVDNAIIEPLEKCELNLEKFETRFPIIQHYVSNKDAEIQTLYALQALQERLKQPKGILNQIFNLLLDKAIITKDVFSAWQKSTGFFQHKG